MNPQVTGLVLITGDGSAPVCADGVCAPVPDDADTAAPAAATPAGGQASAG